MGYGAYTVVETDQTGIPKRQAQAHTLRGEMPISFLRSLR